MYHKLTLNAVRYIEFINRVHLKYGIYKPREVKYPINKRVHKHEYLYMIFHLRGLFIPYLNRMIH